MKTSTFLLCILSLLCWAIQAQSKNSFPENLVFLDFEIGCSNNVIPSKVSNSIDFPPNFDDTDQSSIDCESPYPTPEYIDSTFGNAGFPQGTCDSLQWTYSDSVTQLCAGSYEILRYWEITDPCASEIHSHIQIIKVLDKTPPIIICPEPDEVIVGPTMNNGFQDCTAYVMIPSMQVTDDCSTSNSITYFVWTTHPDGSIVIANTKNAQGYFVLKLPVRPEPHTYSIVQTLIDDCGNKSECTVQVHVRDKTPPVVICDTLSVISLADSITFVNASSFDNGSQDDCSNITFAARRGTLENGDFVAHPCNRTGDFNFNSQINFYCCDLDHSIPLFVELRCRDAYGNDAYCIIPVTVLDIDKPVINCPNDITVQCGLPYMTTGIDTTITCIQPNIHISNSIAKTYPMKIDVLDIPVGAIIVDVDLQLNIDHELVNQLVITLYSPLNRKAMLIPSNSCNGQPVLFPMGMNVTLNDQAYDINWFNQTGLIAPANFTCTSSKPGIGTYNQGHMKPKGDELQIFNGVTINTCTSQNLCFTAGLNDINSATNRISNFQVQLFIQDAGLTPGDRILLEYASSTGTSLGGISIGSAYLFQVINNNTIEFLTITGTDITNVPAGSAHMFCTSRSWMVVVEDTAPLAGGLINEVCLHIAYILNTGLKPDVSDNMEGCGLTVIHQDLQQPGSCPSNTQINRQWTVTDNSGNSSSCIQKILIKDLTEFIVQFPSDVSIACTDNHDLSVTGDVRHNGDCEQVSVTYSDSIIIHSGEYDKLLRTWIIKDDCRFSPDGAPDILATQIDIATNTISFSPNLFTLLNALNFALGDRFILQYSSAGIPISGLEIDQKYNVRWIDSTAIRFENNAITGQPVTFTDPGNGPHLFNYANSDLGVALTCEELFNLAPCLDWDFSDCDDSHLFADDGDGYFYYTQHITLKPPADPQWADCGPEEYCSYDPNCLTELIALTGEPLDPCIDSVTWTFNWEIDFDQDGTIDAQGTGDQAGGTYPIGVHQIVITATNQFGVVNTCSKSFTIRDCAPPAPVCHPTITVNFPLASSGIVTVTAQQLETGLSLDNCTAYDDLDLRLQRVSGLIPGQHIPSPSATSTLNFSCLDLPPLAPDPIVEVAVWVGDASGNWDFCVSTIIIQDDFNECKNLPSSSNLLVQIVNTDEYGVELADVEMTGSLPISGLITDAEGKAYLGLAPLDGDYTVSPSKNINPLNGVSTFDLLLIQQHLLGIKQISNPYYLIAADVNKSCHISISDIFALRKMILIPGSEFLNNTSWRFVDYNYAFPNPLKPCFFPESIHRSTLDLPVNVFKFRGIKIGDVNGDASPNSLLNVDTRNTSGKLYFLFNNESFAAETDLEILIHASDFNQINGYQYSLDFDPEILSFVALEPVWPLLSEENFGLNNVGFGQITTSWHNATAQSLEDDQVLYRIRFRTLKAGNVQQNLKLNNQQLRAEAYAENDAFLDVQFQFIEEGLVGNKFSLFQNVPNPFHAHTDIRFYLPEASQITFKLFDATGICLKTINGFYSKGYHSLTLLRSELPGSGIYYYQLHTDTHSATKSMILME
ncbi:MAG: T9SS type A sorting domain-containing protein [Saprospiraceae bacterium]|nr:T9SS type A sorting domain-containing protein [Saprospiraceae bacterium]